MVLNFICVVTLCSAAPLLARSLMCQCLCPSLSSYVRGALCWGVWVKRTLKPEIGSYSHSLGSLPALAVALFLLLLLLLLVGSWVCWPAAPTSHATSVCLLLFALRLRLLSTSAYSSSYFPSAAAAATAPTYVDLLLFDIMAKYCIANIFVLLGLAWPGLVFGLIPRVHGYNEL